MKLRKAQTGRATSMAYGLTIGTLVCLTITFSSAVIITKLLDQEFMSWETIGYTILATVLIASFSGALISYKKIQHQRLAVCLLTGAAYWAILMSITALFYQAEYEGILVTSVIILTGSMLAFLMSRPRNRKPTSRKYRIAHR